ncbi:twin-arginine translocase TatA/TatE family subunit [Candidatus Sumerlaeota bacterium]|nr:twin-arginine translocase TatA/TatE family subunit [Candidatus Sumerlaeota bacterium]
MSLPGHSEWIILLVIVLLLFGPKKLPQLSRAIGRSIRDFKRGLGDIKDDIERAGEDDEEESRPSPARKGDLPKGSQSAAPSSETDEKNG